MKHHLSLYLTAVFAAVILSIPCQTRAGTIVDTGPAGPLPFNGAWLATRENAFGIMAGKISLTTATTIASVEGWIGYSNRDATGSLKISMGLNPGDALFSGSIATPQLGVIENQWLGLTGLNWFLDAGDYWVTFQGQGGFDGWMTGGAANPLADYGYFNDPDTGWRTGRHGAYGVRIMDDTQNVPDGGASFALLSGALFGVIALRRRFAS